MPEAARHREQCERNARAYQTLGGEQARFLEWPITTLFYIAVHLAEGKIAPPLSFSPAAGGVVPARRTDGEIALPLPFPPTAGGEAARETEEYLARSRSCTTPAELVKPNETVVAGI